MPSLVNSHSTRLRPEESKSIVTIALPRGLGCPGSGRPGPTFAKVALIMNRSLLNSGFERTPERAPLTLLICSWPSTSFSVQPLPPSKLKRSQFFSFSSVPLKSSPHSSAAGDSGFACCSCCAIEGEAAKNRKAQLTRKANLKKCFGYDIVSPVFSFFELEQNCCQSIDDVLSILSSLLFL